MIKIPKDKWEKLLYEFKSHERSCEWAIGDMPKKKTCKDLRKAFEDICGELERFG